MGEFNDSKMNDSMAAAAAAAAAEASGW